jgi:hypothetical protein
MDPLLLLNQAALFVHLIAFAMTLSAVLREDLRWLLNRRISRARLRSTMRTVTSGLLVLWATGLALWAFAAAASPVPWALTAKLSAKLVVVSLLTLNGLAMHLWVFPRLPASGEKEWLARPLPLLLGAFSSASWVYASFVGVARPLSGELSFVGFMALYALAVGFAFAFAFALGVVVWRGAAQLNHSRAIAR